MTAEALRRAVAVVFIGLALGVGAWVATRLLLPSDWLVVEPGTDSNSIEQTGRARVLVVAGIWGLAAGVWMAVSRRLLRRRDGSWY